MTTKIARWTPQRKRILLQEIESGELTETEARRKYDLSVDELLGWQQRYAMHGIAGLAIKQLQAHRRLRRRKATTVIANG